MLKKQLQITKSLFILLALFCFWQPVMGQSALIKGKVTEKPSNLPLTGATVVEVNENNRQVSGTVTDESGNYSLRVSDIKNKLRFSYITFNSKEENIGSRTVINASLTSSSEELETVAIVGKREEKVQTGFGTTSPRDIIGAVSTVKAEVLAEQPATSIDQMLQGRASGVQITSNSGDPGAGVDIRIRGAGSVAAGNDPLYVIDGVPIISTPFDNTNEGANVARINPIADINPLDIESIDILKDANAAAIYGARAAGGVIMVTTKRGRKGFTNIAFNTQFGLQQGPPSIPVLDGSAYKVMRLEAEQNFGNINPGGATLLPLVDDPSYPMYQYYQANTDWMSLLKQTGSNQVYNLAVNGGGESLRYSFSTSYTDVTGSMINTGNQRFTGRFNLDYNVSDRLRFGSNTSFARSKVNNYTNYNFQNVYEVALIRSSAMPAYDVDVDGNPLPTFFSLPGVSGTDNPLANATTVSNDAYSTNLKPNIYGEYDITKALKFRSNASIDFLGESGMLFLPPEATGEIWNNSNFNRVDARENERVQMIVDNYLTYNKLFKEKLKTQIILGSTFNTFSSDRLLISGSGSASGQVQTIGSTASYRETVSERAKETIVSLFAKSDFVYNDKYGINFTVRRDGSSKFGNDYRYAVFPSVGGYWRVSGEPFFGKLKFISDLKLRASWGQLGNSNIANYAYISQFNSGSNYGGANGVSQNNPQLLNLRWETSETTNLGLNMELFKKRLLITAEWYNKDTKDLLYPLIVPGSAGLAGNWISNFGNANSYLTNLGTIRNRGLEFDLSLDAIKAKKKNGFTWNMSFNIGHNKNEVRSLPGGTLNLTDNYARFSSQVKQGDPLGTYYGLVFKGVYAYDADATVKDADGNIVYELDGTTPRIMKIDSETGLSFKGGDAIYEDFNHDGIINGQDRVLIGNANPDFFGGFNNTFSYKNFGMRFFIQFQYGNDIINGMRYNLESMINTNNQAVTTLQRWRKQGDVTTMPRALREDGRNTYGSSRWIEDGSYARLKFVTLTYRVPTEFLKRFKVKGLDTFITGNNLLTWTKYTGADPEIKVGSNPAFIGIDRGLTPQTMGATLGLNLRF